MAMVREPFFGKSPT